MFELLKSIKADRQITLKHWRYRLLHWFFGVNEENARQKLPKFFYTHYCPLFHFTNLVAVGLPLILVFKAFIYIFYSLGIGVTTIINAIPESPKKELTEEERVKIVTDEIIRYLKINSDTLYNKEGFLRGFISSTIYDYKLYEIIYDKWAPILQKQVKEEEVKKAARQQRIVFWVNFSQVFFRWAVNIFYLLLAVAAVYYGIPLLISMLGGILSLLKWGFTINWLDFGFKTLCFVISLVIAVISATLLYNVLSRCGFIVNIISIPFGIFRDVTKDVFTFIFKSMDNTVEFVGAFFEENCPKVTIIEDEE